LLISSIFYYTKGKGWNPNAFSETLMACVIAYVFHMDWPMVNWHTPFHLLPFGYWHMYCFLTYYGLFFLRNHGFVVSSCCKIIGCMMSCANWVTLGILHAILLSLYIDTLHTLSFPHTRSFSLTRPPYVSLLPRSFSLTLALFLSFLDLSLSPSVSHANIIRVSSPFSPPPSSTFKVIAILFVVVIFVQDHPISSVTFSFSCVASLSLSLLISLLIWFLHAQSYAAKEHL
jgi:hypothetical protein